MRRTVYLRDFADFAAMNAVYRTYFPADAPARATVGVTALAADYRVEIEVTRRALTAERLAADDELVDGHHTDGRRSRRPR